MIRIKNNLTPRLPNEYQEVEYIESTGSQYIDTQYQMTSATKVELKVTITNPIASSLAIGCWDTNLNGFLFGIDADGQFRFAYANGGWNGESVTYDSNQHIIYVDGTNAKLDGVVKATAGNKAITTTSNIYLLWIGSYQKLNKAAARIYYCKIYNNDILIREFIPCYRKLDNTAGLYDLANGVFYANQGTGVFLMGEAVGKADVNLMPMIGNKKVLKRYIGENLVYLKVVDTEFSSCPFPTIWVKVGDYEYTATNDLGTWKIVANTGKNVNNGFDGDTYTAWKPNEIKLKYRTADIELPSNILIKPTGIYIKIKEIGDNSYVQGFNPETNVWETIKTYDKSSSKEETITYTGNIFFSKFRISVTRYSGQFNMNSLYEFQIISGTLRKEN